MKLFIYAYICVFTVVFTVALWAILNACPEVNLGTGMILFIGVNSAVIVSLLKDMITCFCEIRN